MHAKQQFLIVTLFMSLDTHLVSSHFLILQVRIQDTAIGIDQSQAYKANPSTLYFLHIDFHPVFLVQLGKFRNLIPSLHVGNSVSELSICN